MKRRARRKYGRSGIGDRSRSAGDVEFRVVLRGFGPMRVWAPDLRKANKCAAAQAYADRTG
jgi:hypothetical protein